MKCFERLAKEHITSTLPNILDPLQFTYRPNRSRSLCNCVMGFLMGRLQVKKVGNNTSATLILNTGAPQA
jgi:hypothetical protein